MTCSKCGDNDIFTSAVLTCCAGPESKWKDQCGMSLGQLALCRDCWLKIAALVWSKES